ncbi:hypothetical protein [Roseibium sp. LAB1]
MDTAEGSNQSSGYSAGVSVGIGLGADGAGPTFGASASVNGAKGSNSSAWVNAPSGIVTDNALNADVGETTSITGGVIASRSGDLTLETERLETADIDLHRKGRQVSGSVGVSIGSNPEGKSKPGITVEGAYSNSETEGVARATIGEGEITVRDGDGDGIKAADLEAEADAAEAEGDTARAEALRTEADREAAEDTTATETQLSNLNRDPDAVVEVTSQKQEGFELYVSDTSVKDAFKAVKLVGHAASSIVSSVMERMGDENSGLKDLAQAKRAGHLSDEAILTQLAGCNPQHGFNLWQLFVSPAYARGTCSVTTSNGYVINLSDDETRQCLEIYLGTMIANPEDAGRWADLLRNGNLTAPVRAMGAIAAMSNGPYVTGYGEDGEGLVTTDGNGRFLYKNTVTGDLFFANPLDVGDPAVISYVSDASAVGGPGTSFTTVRLALAPKFVGKAKAPKEVITSEQFSRLGGVGRQYYTSLRSKGVPAVDAYNAAKGNMMHMPYAPRVRQRAVEDPGGHNFPRSIDEKMFEVPPVVVRGGGLGYAIQGTRNGAPVVFNTIVKNGRIIHRDAIPASQWGQRSRSFGWPGTLNDIPTGTVNWPGH